MSSTRVIFTYKRKRLSSCSGPGHAVACPDFSLDVQVGKDQPSPKEGSEKTEKDPVERDVSNCSSARLHESCGAKEKFPVQMSGTSHSRELQLCSKASNELSVEKKCKTSGEHSSTEASLQDFSFADNDSSCLDLDSRCFLTDQVIQGGVVSRSMEEPDSHSELGCTGNIEVVQSKLTAPLLTFSRRLKRKTDLGGTIVLGELPTNEKVSATGEEKATCKSSCSSDIPSNGDPKVANDEAVTRNLLCETMIGDESRGHCPCTRTGADIPVLRHTEEKSYSRHELVLDTSPVIGQISVKTSAFDGHDVLETTNLAEDIVVRSSNNEVLSSCNNGSKADEQHASHQAQTFSGGSQLTSSDSSDIRRCAGKIVQRMVSSAPVDPSRPASGAFLIDCNVIPESDLHEIESDSVQNSSPIMGNCEKIMEAAHLKSKGLELFGDNDMKVVKPLSSDVARLHRDEHAPFATEIQPKTKCLQLFSEDGQSSLFAPTSKKSETGCCRAQQNAALTLDGGKDQFDAPTKGSAILGLSLAMEPMYEGQTSQHGSDVHLYQDHNVGFKEFTQNPVFHSFPDHSSTMLRHKVLLESCNTRATALRGNRNISLDRSEPYPTMWSEEELDSLWIGIRRHGRGNWHAMLLDPRLRFAPWRVARDLADQWEREQYWLLSGEHVPAGRCAKPPDAYSVDSNTRVMYPKACVVRERVSTETQLSLGDVYARKGRGRSRSKTQSQPHMHVTVASKLGNYSCGSYATVQTSVMIGNGPPGVGSVTNTPIPLWLREPSGSTSSLFEPSPPQISTQLQTGGFQPVHLFSAPSSSSSGQRNLNVYKFPGPAGESSGSLLRNQNKADKPIVIDSDASSEETISDDHNIRT